MFSSFCFLVRFSFLVWVSYVSFCFSLVVVDGLWLRRKRAESFPIAGSLTSFEVIG